MRGRTGAANVKAEVPMPSSSSFSARLRRALFVSFAFSASFAVLAPVQVRAASTAKDKAADAPSAKAAPKSAAKSNETPAAKATGAKTGEAGKEVTLEGEMMCARCNLHETKACQSVLKVKDVKYYFVDNAVARENVENVCGGGSKHAIVTGVVSEADGKMQIAPSAVKLP
jgi:hypothetical protein